MRNFLSLIPITVIAVFLGLSSGNSALALSLTKYSRNDFDQAFPNSVLEDWDSQKQGTRINNGQTLNGITYNTSSGAALVTTKFLPSTQPKV